MAVDSMQRGSRLFCLNGAVFLVSHLLLPEAKINQEEEDQSIRLCCAWALLQRSLAPIEAHRTLSFMYMYVRSGLESAQENGHAY